ncbi:FHA domain-containing protein [Frigidibacter sp. ROC022]|uniref:FHA domain-containing protein n=1 Tax=Frigidibacter sp. ROC022 TaxID=2971796 RepID=UPI00215B4AC2|nr:FHA domain-containing protein [Frigidibacter sp. ROC022]MCR8725026.1 FHA domain-containing protein [Frigidibacter sp. ROC022]
MSFIKDLIAWKARPDRAAAHDAEDDRLDFETGAEDADYADDWDDDDFDEDDFDEDDFDEDELDEEDLGVLDDVDPAPARPPVKAAAAARAAAPKREKPEPSHNHVDSVDVDDILNRVAQRNAARATQADGVKVVQSATPPKIWEMNVGPAAPAQAPAAAPAKARARPRPEPAAQVAPAPAPAPQPAPQAAAPAPGPATQPVQPETSAEPPRGQNPRPAGRVKTRLLGFHNPGAVPSDPFDTDAIAPATGSTKFPTGWVVVIEGPGRGTCFTLQGGVSQIGRGEGQAIRLDFGDQSISRNNHAAIAYDDEVGRFYLGHGGKLNLVRLNDRPVLSTEELATNDKIRIGETILKFVALCGDGFSWTEEPGRDANAIAG